MRRHTSSFMAILVTLALALPIAQAQEFRSTINGQVVDAQGAVVPGASITAKNADTGAAFTTKSGETGQFTLPFVPPGTYTIAAEAPGPNSILERGWQSRRTRGFRLTSPSRWAPPPSR